MRSDIELCCIYTPVAQCCYVTMYWLLQTISVNTVQWSCSSNVICHLNNIHFYYYYYYYYTTLMIIMSVRGSVDVILV